ncbi:MAG: phosphate signaling complex protein PhoU [Actinobacteria bacterium]|nr:MAG: phosphate signaling complex protein PhoU [Actinomycetota bacterium]
MRKIFHDELKLVKKDILKMGVLVEQRIHNAINALVNDDLASAEEVVKGDDDIDKFYIDLEANSMRLLATQSPVAKDLRFIYSVLFVTIHLERMGDLASNIASMVSKASGGPRLENMLGIIQEMGVLSSKIVHSSLEAFDKKDLELAKRLPEMDEPIDNLFKLFFKELVNQAGNEETVDAASNMVLAARYVERIADHAVDIGERVNFLVTGQL